MAMLHCSASYEADVVVSGGRLLLLQRWTLVFGLDLVDRLHSWQPRDSRARALNSCGAQD